MHASWPLWLLIAAIIVLPLALRFCAGDDEPDNAITQEQDGARREPDDDGLLLAA